MIKKYKVEHYIEKYLCEDCKDGELISFNGIPMKYMEEFNKLNPIGQPVSYYPHECTKCEEVKFIKGNYPINKEVLIEVNK